MLLLGLAHPHKSLYCTGRVCFAVGQNVQFCHERYGMCMPDLSVLPPKQKLKTAVDNDIVRRVGMIQELIMDREGNISLSDVFSARDFSIFIDFCVAISRFVY